LGSKFSNDNTIDHDAEMMKEKDEIEESIIEEEINDGQGGASPGTPIINSRTKVKGKDLKLMKPPKPFHREVSFASNKISPFLKKPNAEASGP
jgi:hypothetical protein